jgi:hypothetical protein
MESCSTNGCFGSRIAGVKMLAKELAAILMKYPNNEIFFDGLGRDIVLDCVEMGVLKVEEDFKPVLVIELRFSN